MKAFYMSLNPTEKELFNYYFHFYSGYDGSRKSFTLMSMAASMIPQGHYELAQKLLYKAADTTTDLLLLARIHLNLTQLFHDLALEKPQLTAKRNYHRKKVLDCGYFQNYIEANFK